MIPRHLILPDRGTLLVSTDLHGNAEDFLRLRQHFEKLLQKDPQSRWLLLGDVVHGPDEQARQDQPEFYDFPDESYRIVEGIMDLQALHPRQVIYVLGNHDHGHVGGPRPAKFYPDEVHALEEKLDPEQVARLRAFFEEAVLAVAAPCGLLFCHGVPDDSLRDLCELDRIGLRLDSSDGDGQHVLSCLLRAYGQQASVVERMFLQLDKAHPGLDLRMVIHGHDRDPEGFFVEEGNQICPVIFGALKEHKRYLVLDLAKRYERPVSLREGKETRRLYA